MRARTLAFLLLLAGAAVGQQQTPIRPAEISAVPRNAADSVGVTLDGSKTRVTVTSPRGIGGLTLERKGERWPGLTLRLNLRGLESLKLTAGRLMLNAAVSSQRDGGRLLTISTDGKAEQSIDRPSPYWMDVRIFDGRGRPIESLPSAGGWFECDLPTALLREAPRTVSVEWIDFYR